MTTEASVPRRKLSAIVMVGVSGLSRMMARNEERTALISERYFGTAARTIRGHEFYRLAVARVGAPYS